MSKPLDRYFAEHFPPTTPIYDSMVHQYNMDPAFSHRRRKHLDRGKRGLLKLVSFGSRYGSPVVAYMTQTEEDAWLERELKVAMFLNSPEELERRAVLWKALEPLFDDPTEM